MNATKPKNIDEYIAGFPKDIQSILGEIRDAVKKAAPEAQEVIKYDMHTIYRN